jgi:hypothetical protein
MPANIIVAPHIQRHFMLEVNFVTEGFVSSCVHLTCILLAQRLSTPLALPGSLPDQGTGSHVAYISFS